jgi:hypothetical protein
MNFLDRAVPLLERGFSIIPLEPKDKKPIAGMGVTRRTQDGATVTAWAEKYADANVAVCADETFLILDADDATAMLGITGPLNTYTVQSSPGKAHYYFRRDPEAFNYIRNLEMGKVGSLRASNQYVVAAGSIHPKTGEPYVVINDAPVAIMDPAVYHKLEIAAQEAEREIERIRANWDGVSKIPAGMRQYFLTSQAGKLHDGVRTEEEILAELMALNLQFCDPPKPESEISRLAAWVMSKEPNKTGPEVLMGSFKPKGQPAAPSSGMVFGLYRRGAVNICHGPSGVGKTRFHLEMESAAREGREFLSANKSNAPRSTLYILRDRPLQDHYDTLESMELPRDFVPVVEMADEVFDAKAMEEIEALIEKHDRPELTVVEGLDIVMTSTVKPQIMNPLLKRLQRVAGHTGSCIVGTWGAPKRQSNPRERYLDTRMAASGSGSLSRQVQTMVGLSFEYGPRVGQDLDRPKTGNIIVSIDTRGKGRSARLRFNAAGRMEEGLKVEIDPGPPDMTYTQAQEWAKEVLDMSKSTFNRRKSRVQ